MTKQTHTVATDALATLGTIIDDAAGRDAIHLAVEPVIAGEQLHPGQHIRIDNGVAVANGETFGVVDPFLKGIVRAGQRFWFVIYPRQITSLRHVWEHPAFPLDAVVLAPTADTRPPSEAWMRRWAVEHMSDDYYGDRDRLSDDEAYAMAISAGENNHVGPYEYARDHIDGEWWSHWEAITGKTGRRDEYFSCGC